MTDVAEYNATIPPTRKPKPKHKAKAKAKTKAHAKAKAAKAKRFRCRSREQIVAGQFAWGAAEIGSVINRNQAQTFHLIYSGALGDAVSKVNGQHVGVVPKLIRLLGGE